MLLTIALALSFAAAAPQQDPLDPESQPGGRDSYLGREVAKTMHWRGAPWLLRETRENEENGARLLEWLAVQPGDAVCDLGCGNGYHALPLAVAVGPKGKLFAVDLQPEMLDLLSERATDLGIDNLIPIEATLDDPRLPAASIDLVLMVDVYHELSHPVSVLGHLKRALKEDGRVVLVEFRTEDRSVPIKPRHKMTKAQVIREMAANGFRLNDETDALPWQHAMAFEVAPPDASRLEALELTRGFVTAMGGLDPRLVEPYLATEVDVGGERVAAKALAVSIGETMRGIGPPIPRGTGVELVGGGDGSVRAILAPRYGGVLWRTRNELMLSVDNEGRWQVEAWRTRARSRREHGSLLPLAVMHTGLGGLSPRAAATELDALGFDGVACGLGSAARFRAACDPLGMDVFSSYAVLDLAGDLKPLLVRIEEEMAALAGGPGMIWLALEAKGEPSDAHRVTALRALKRLGGQADRTGVEVALYPHTGFWLATTEQAVQLAEEVDHDRVGVCFNLCHYLRRNEEPLVSTLLERAAPRLMAVTLNGAETASDDWSGLIQPLGSGDHDLRALLDVLEEIEFDGPVGLQGYGIRLPPLEHLGQSMGAWRRAHSGPISGAEEQHK